MTWEYGYRNDDGHVWPWDDVNETGASLKEIGTLSKEDWFQYEVEGCTLYRRHAPIEAGAWEVAE